MCMYVTKINSFIFKLYTYINWYIHPYNIVINQYFFSIWWVFSSLYFLSPLSTGLHIMVKKPADVMPCWLNKLFTIKWVNCSILRFYSKCAVRTSCGILTLCHVHVYVYSVGYSLKPKWNVRYCSKRNF